MIPALLHRGCDSHVATKDRIELLYHLVWGTDVVRWFLVFEPVWRKNGIGYSVLKITFGGIKWFWQASRPATLCLAFASRSLIQNDFYPDGVSEILPEAKNGLRRLQRLHINFWSQICSNSHLNAWKLFKRPKKTGVVKPLLNLHVYYGTIVVQLYLPTFPD